MARIDAHAVLTDQIIEAIENADGTWVMPWHRASGGLPSNAVTKNSYNGGNIIALWCAASAAGYDSPKWASYKQWASIGAQVRKGERGTHIVYYGSGEKENGDKFRFARVSAIFNAAQVDGFEDETATVLIDETTRNSDADAMIVATGAQIMHTGGRAFYSPSSDSITVPERKQFKATEKSSATENYYGTVFHELVHWTGTEKRCAREFGKRFGDEAYAIEELTAEIGAAFLCAEMGVTSEPREDHALYLRHWLKILKSDPKAIFTAAGKASEAVKFLRK